MAPISIEDLIASLKSNGIGQEANDLAAVKAHLSKTLSTQAGSRNPPNATVGFAPARDNTPQGTPVTQYPPGGSVPWGDDRARRRRSQSRGMDAPIDEEDEPMDEDVQPEPVRERGRWPRRPLQVQQDFSMFAPASAPLSPPASPTAARAPQHQQQHHHYSHSSPATQAVPPVLVPQDFQSAYAASSDPFLAAQQAHPYYHSYLPQSPPMQDPYASAWPSSAWPTTFAASAEVVSKRTR